MNIEKEVELLKRRLSYHFINCEIRSYYRPMHFYFIIELLFENNFQVTVNVSEDDLIELPIDTTMEKILTFTKKSILRQYFT